MSQKDIAWFETLVQKTGLYKSVFETIQDSESRTGTISLYQAEQQEPNCCAKPSQNTSQNCLCSVGQVVKVFQEDLLPGGYWSMVYYIFV